MDTGLHFRAMWRRRGWVLAVALAVGLAVLVLRVLQAPVYTVDADLFLVAGDTGSTDQAAEVQRLTLFYTAIVSDPRVVADVGRRTGMRFTARELRAVVDVTSPDKGQLTVTARQPTAAGAVRLVNATGDALAYAAGRDQLAARDRDLEPLNRELNDVAAGLATVGGDAAARRALLDRQGRALDARVQRLTARPARLDVVRRPSSTGAAVRSPDPVRDAVLAFLLALVLAAEAAALLAARRHGLEGRDPVPTLHGWTGLPVLRVGPSRHGVDETASALRLLGELADGGAVHLLTLGAGPVVAGTAEALRDAARRTRAGAPAGGQAGASGGRGHGPSVVVSPWDDPQVLDPAVGTARPSVLLVDADEVREPSLREAVRVLGHAGRPARAVLVAERETRTGGLLRRR